MRDSMQPSESIFPFPPRLNVSPRNFPPRANHSPLEDTLSRLVPSSQLFLMPFIAILDSSPILINLIRIVGLLRLLAMKTTAQWSASGTRVRGTVVVQHSHRTVELVSIQTTLSHSRPMEGSLSLSIATDTAAMSTFRFRCGRSKLAIGSGN